MESGRIKIESGREKTYMNTEIAVDTERKPDFSIENEDFRRKI
jgi:hypothetical protein